MKGIFIIIVCAATLLSCSSSSDRRPANTSRAGRPYQEPKVMNRQNLDTQTLFEACVKEWPELYCRNRMGR